MTVQRDLGNQPQLEVDAGPNAALPLPLEGRHFLRRRRDERRDTQHDARSCLLRELVLGDPSRRVAKQSGDQGIGVEQLPIGHLEVIEHPPLNGQDRGEGGAARAGRRSPRHEIARPKADERHGEGVEPGGHELPRLAGFRGSTIHQHFEDDAVVRHVHAGAAGTLPADEPELVRRVHVDDARAERVTDLAPLQRQQHLATADDEAWSDRVRPVA